MNLVSSLTVSLNKRFPILAFDHIAGSHFCRGSIAMMINSETNLWYS